MEGQTTGCQTDTDRDAAQEDEISAIVFEESLSETTKLTDDSKSVKTLDDVIGGLKFGLFHWKMLALACGAYFSACTQMMLLIYLSGPVKAEWGLDTMVYPVLLLLRGICSITASFVAGSLGDKYGRQRPLFVSLIMVSVFGLLTAFPPHFSLLVIAVCMVAVGTSGIEAVNFVLLLGISLFSAGPKRGFYVDMGCL